MLVIANPIPKKGEKKKKKTREEAFSIPNPDYNLSVSDPAVQTGKSLVYKLLDTREVLRWLHKRYPIKNIIADQPNTRYDVAKFKTDEAYKKMIINRRRSKQHYVRIADNEEAMPGRIQILILNSSNGRCKLRIILCSTTMISSEERTFVRVEMIHGYAEFKHEDVAEKKLDDILKEFWATIRVDAYKIKDLMTQEVKAQDLQELCQHLADVKINKKSPVLSASDIMERVQKQYNVISYNALYQVAMQYIKEKNNLLNVDKNSIWILQKEIKIAQCVLDIFKTKLGY